MSAYIIEVNWLRRFRNDQDTPLNPAFSAWLAMHDTEGLSNQLRSAFAFLRAHGNGRYSSASLMKLLREADRLDDAIATGGTVEGQTVPTVAVASMPYNYDEETEVKSGGVIAVAVVLPDGRLMMAVNRETRRQRVGTALYHFATNFLNRNPAVWVHQANVPGAQFCLSLDLLPREMNSRGAVVYCGEALIDADDELAAAEVQDWEYADAMELVNAQRRHTTRRFRTSRTRPRPAPESYYDEVPEDAYSDA